MYLRHGSSLWTHNLGVCPTKKAQSASLRDRGSVCSDANGIYVLDHQGKCHAFPDRYQALVFAKVLFHSYR